MEKIKIKIRNIKLYFAELLLKKSLSLNPYQLTRLEELNIPLGMYGEKFRFLEDGLATIHACDFLSNKKFLRAYHGGVETGSWNGWNLRWRLRIILWAAGHAAKIPGDFVECGVNKGGFTQSILEYIDLDLLGKKYYLFDTFNGFDKHQLDAVEEKLAAHYSYPDCFAEVKDRFEKIPFINIVRGSVPRTLPGAGIKNVAFLSIDMNCVEPEIAAVEFFWPLLSTGGLIILDDYGFTLHQAQKEAFNKWSYTIGVDILELPTGQGLIIKQ